MALTISIDVGPVHEARDGLVLVPGGLDGRVAEGLGEERQRLQAPLLQGGVVAFGRQGLHQVPHAPGDDDALALDGAAPGALDAQSAAAMARPMLGFSLTMRRTKADSGSPILRRRARAV